MTCSTGTHLTLPCDVDASDEKAHDGEVGVLEVSVDSFFSLLPVCTFLLFLASSVLLRARSRKEPGGGGESFSKHISKKWPPSIPSRQRK